MKKTIIATLAALSMGITALAGPLGSRALFQGDHKTIHMSPDGSCWFDSRQTGRITGSYDVQGSVEPGCSNVRVIFNLGGSTYAGTLMWPTSGTLSLYFDNSLMERKL
ncbi:MAG: hypothetical protein NC406_09820 [Bacteroides sp.]|nr:hypothetical protein [Bacteroides sp.]MCM1096164.1 hypothetical protein [Terasakiella sp.]